MMFNHIFNTYIYIYKHTSHKLYYILSNKGEGEYWTPPKDQFVYNSALRDLKIISIKKLEMHDHIIL